jgi:hypothetical protein
MVPRKQKASDTRCPIKSTKSIQRPVRLLLTREHAHVVRRALSWLSTSIVLPVVDAVILSLSEKIQRNKPESFNFH